MNLLHFLFFGFWPGATNPEEDEPPMFTLETPIYTSFTLETPVTTAVSLDTPIEEPA